SAALLSDLGLVMYFSTLPAPSSFGALHLSHSDAPSRLYPNVYFDTPSFVLRIAHTKPMAAPFQERPSRHGHYIHYKNSNLKHLFVSAAKVGRDRRNGNTKNWVF
ncbi:MAG: hypothetical protein SOV62_01945, partial [Alloprevotella sp.]|nr:hypothetical protein [Alloprevotella sp.]